jgi:hypothetical protein
MPMPEELKTIDELNALNALSELRAVVMALERKGFASTDYRDRLVARARQLLDLYERTLK